MSDSSPSAPQAPAYSPIDIPGAIANALNYDTAGYNWSDADFVSRFPGLVATRNQQIDDAYNQLTGPLDPTVENMFTKGGLQAGLNATGSGDPLSGLGMTEGSFGRNTASTTMANSLLQKQDYDRSYLDQLIANNPERAFGISGQGVTNLSLANVGALNASNQQNYQATLAQIYGTGQANAATGQQITAIANILARLNTSGGSGGGYGGGGGYGA